MITYLQRFKAIFERLDCPGLVPSGLEPMKLLSQSGRQGLARKIHEPMSQRYSWSLFLVLNRLREPVLGDFAYSV